MAVILAEDTFRPATDHPLWKTTQEFPLDDPESKLTFTRRLVREQHEWSPEFAARVVEEYRRFFFLMCTSPHSVTPSEQVDQAWHLHLLYSQSYRELSMSTAGRMIDHGPTKGGQAQIDHFYDQYARTLERYREAFGEEPPSDIWPAPDKRFSSAEELRWVDTSKYVLIERNTAKWLAGLLVASCLLIGSGLMGAL